MLHRPGSKSFFSSAKFIIMLALISALVSSAAVNLPTVKPSPVQLSELPEPSIGTQLYADPELEQSESPVNTADDPGRSSIDEQDGAIRSVDYTTLLPIVFMHHPYQDLVVSPAAPTPTYMIYIDKRWATDTPTLTPEITLTSSPTVAVTQTATSTSSPSPTQTNTPKPTRTPRVTPKPSATYTDTPEPTPTDTLTPTPTATQTDTPEPTATATFTPSPTATQTDTPEPTATATFTPSPTATQTDTPEPIPTATFTPTATQTDTPEPTQTVTFTPTATQTDTPEPTQTATITPSPTTTQTDTAEPTPTATFTPSPEVTQTDTPEPTATLTPTPNMANIFGLMIPMDTPGRTAAAEIGPKYFRNITSVFASGTVSCPDCVTAAMDGYQLVITIRYNRYGSPPPDLDDYANFIESFILTYHPWGIVIENEESAAKMYSGTPSEYAAQLEAACGVAATYGVKCMNGGLASKAVLLLIWDNIYGGYPDPAACTFAHEAFDPIEADDLCDGASSAVLTILARTEEFYNLYSTSDIDYVNLHFYVEATESGTNLSVLDDAIAYMEATGKPALINEWGLRLDDSTVLENMMDILRSEGIPVAIYFTPYPSALYAVYELENNDGTLTHLGQHFRDYIDLHELR